MTTQSTLTVRRALKRARDQIRAAAFRGDRVRIDTNSPLTGSGEHLVIRPAPADGGGILLGCYRYRREVAGQGVSPWRDL